MSHILTSYKGISICTNPDGSETGISDAGEALNDNFQFLADHAFVPGASVTDTNGNSVTVCNGTYPISASGVSRLWSGTLPTMGFPYESAVTGSDADNKLGVYTSTPNPGSATPGFGGSTAVTLGYTEALDVNGYHPGFEMQCMGGNTALNDNYLRFNFLERDSDGNVTGATYIDIIDVFADGTVVLAGALQVGGPTSLDGGAITTDGSGNLTVATLIAHPSSAPASPTRGQIYFNSTSNHFFGWNGSAWKQLDN